MQFIKAFLTSKIPVLDWPLLLYDGRRVIVLNSRKISELPAHAIRYVGK